MTGVVGWEGGEQLGVTKSSLLGDKLTAWPGEMGGWSGRGMVGLMPGILTGSDINWGGWVGGKGFPNSSFSSFPTGFQSHLSSYLPPDSLTEVEQVG